MADYLTTNWTEKIKTNPVANMILNGKKGTAIQRVNIRQVLKLPRKGVLDSNTLFKYSKAAPGIVTLHDYLNDDNIDPADDINDVVEELNRPRRREFAKKTREKAKRRVAKEKEKERKEQEKQHEKLNDNSNGNGINENENDNSNENININADEQVQAQGLQFIHENDELINNDVAARKGAIGKNKEDVRAHASHGEVAVRLGEQSGNAIVIEDDASDISSDNELVDIDENDPMLVGFDMPDTVPSSGMWDNVYVKDFININHPKLRSHYISALATRPVQIAEPSVFFSDV